MKRYLIFKVVILISILAVIQPQSVASADEAVVHAVLFYSPTCPHCQQVITDDLPPLLEKYGEQLMIVGIDTSVREGAQMYQSSIVHFNIPENRRGVPTMIVGKEILLGGFEIPERFPSIVEAGLESGGIDWPDIPGFKELISSSAQQEDQNPVPEPDKVEISIKERFAQDLSGNLLAVIVLIGMSLSVLWIAVSIARPLSFRIGYFPSWVVPILTLLGLIVSIYLSYVEMTQTEAVCGPIGDCNTVQQSQYANLFNLIPIGILGIFGYLLIGISWLVQNISSSQWKQYTTISLWCLAAFGTAFSIYLTILEPFFIGATCAWCITSAIIMTLIFLAATNPALSAWNDLKQRS